MKYHNTLDLNRGFTLLEILISMGILASLVAVSLPYTVTLYQRYQLDTERSQFVSLLREARSRAMAGQDSAWHGVYIASTQYTVYEGMSYATRSSALDEVTNRISGISIIGSADMPFEYLYGRTASRSFTISNSSKSSTVKVNSEGRIQWSTP